MTNVTPQGGVPPGWYPDRRDPAREQWWSGAGWTQDFQPVGTPARHPAPVPPSAPRRGGTRSGSRPKASASTNALFMGISAAVSTVVPLTWAWIFGVLVSVGAVMYGIAGIAQSARTGEGLGKSIIGLILGAIATVIWGLGIFAGGYLDRFSWW